MIQLTKRNLKVFFRDKASVFFSLLAVFIIIGLYVLFLGDLIQTQMEDLGEYARFLSDSWIMAGLLSVTAITTTMGAFGIMVEDRSKKILMDFQASPLKRSSMTGGYILSSYIIGVAMCAITLVLAEIYIVAYGGELLSFTALLQVLGVLLLSVLASSAIVFFIVSFFKSANAFATASTILGTMIGFLTGIYIPVGSLPGAVQTIIKIFPISHSGVLLRQIMCEAPLAGGFAGAPQEAQEAYRLMMGIDFQFGDQIISPLGSILILAGTAAVFFLLAMWNLSRKRTKI